MAQILKKNILSIVCGVVILGAIIAYFLFVTDLYEGSDGLKAAASQRRAKYEQLQGLITKSRTLPVVELNSTEAKPLEIFPIPNAVKAGELVTKQLQEQSRQIGAMATAMNRKEPLIPGIFPTPTDPQKFRYRDRYEVYMTKDIPAMLNATTPPSEADVQKAREGLWRAKYADRIIKVNDREVNREQVDRDYLEEVQGLLEELERQAAQKHRMYIEAEAINKNPHVASQTAPQTDELWYAQTALWVQTEVVQAIAGFNDRELKAISKDPADHNIMNAPIKHLILLQVPQGVDQYIAKAATAEGATPGAPDYDLSPTGRNSNSLYDVVKFNLVIKADARYVARMMHELGRGRFITIHKVNLTAVDNAVAKSDGFVYGSAPIVQVQITGESLLMREWTKPLVPEPVKKHLPQFEEPAKPAEEPPPAETAAAQ